MSFGVMATRRGRESLFGSSYSLISLVLVSTRATRLVPNCTTYRLFFESIAMPYGRDFAVGGVSSLMSPVLGSRRPMRFAFCTVNHSVPFLSNTIVCGSPACGSGILYSVTSPVFGLSLPTSAPVLPVYQMLPALSSTRPWGPECAVFSGYSFTLPVFGSTRPSTLAIWPVYQSEPSFAASGSCGREPGVAASHAFMETLSGPGTMAASGRPLTGYVLTRYDSIAGSCSAGTGAPWFFIMRITVFQPSSV